uniref:GT23 domain-containing protein n=2 Tax=Amorphochlora amoebiformis TaxID=1561963 RepID=A0A7S0CYC4_9EUKA|mmetsp:Transcript_15951/g.25259  ORF Transcript_15951/g.25259 Transcript_15951/m.25259 type:complete len:473 (+) Transcript_15951:184-1602(+)
MTQMSECEETVNSSIANISVTDPDFVHATNVYTPENFTSVRKIEKNREKNRIYSARIEVLSRLAFLTSHECPKWLFDEEESEVNPVITLRVVEWGFGATVHSLVKPIIHAMRYGYCIQGPIRFEKYNCSEGWEELFRPLNALKPEFFSKYKSLDFAQIASKLAKEYKGAREDDHTGCVDAMYMMDLSTVEMFGYSEYRRCMDLYSFPKYGASLLPKPLQEFGMFQVVSFILHALMRPNKDLRRHINTAKREALWPKKGTPVIGLHIRRGDSCLEAPWALGRLCEDGLGEYWQAMDLLAEKYLKIKKNHTNHLKLDPKDTNMTRVHVYVATDSEQVIKSLAAGEGREELNKTSKSIEFQFHAVKTLDRDGVRNKMSVDDALIDGELDGCLEARQASIDTILLSKADILIGKFSGNMDRLAYSLQFARLGAYPPYISLDNSWCYDFGVQSRPNLALEVDPSTEDDPHVQRFVFC